MRIEPLFLLYLVISIIHCMCLNLCLDDQRSLLLQFKNNLTFDHQHSTKLKTWNQSIACCDWSGVTCDDDAHVIALDLSDEGIQGGFDNSSSFFSLQHLQFLNLALNDFNSPIPSTFNKLKNLTSLNLECAGFVGQVPIEISQLTRLVTLDLSSIYKISKLEIPYYSRMSFTQDFSRFLGKKSKLESPNFEKLAQNLTSIRQLYLDGVSISSEGHKWRNALLLLPYLQELSMSKCGLMGTFPQEVFQITTLSSIDISYNQDLYGSFPDFPLNGSLHTIIVSHTKFSGRLPLSIGNMVQLSTLDLSNSNFSGTLPSSFSKLTELKEMDLSNNNFVGPIPSLGKAKKLAYIDLSCNGLSGSLSSAQLEGLQSLSIIGLSYNSISGTIPWYLFMLPSFEVVDLSHNQFDKLEEFRDVFSSKLVQFGGLNQSSIIDLSYNSISGSIPSSLFVLPSLWKLYLSNNQFSKLEEFTNVSSSMLDTLDLSCNNLSGSIPTSIIQLSGLTELYLSSNKFKGPMLLDALMKLNSLLVLDLSFNDIDDVCVTHVELSSFSKITNLKLASCKLKTFPGFLSYQSTLIYLNLSNNQIQGTIPSWIWSLHTLYTLDVSYNFLTNLEGPLQNHSSYMAHIYLQFNQLQGPIPGFLHYITIVDYSNNNFSSVIPTDIGYYMSGTYYFSLANNNIDGSIPHSLCNAPMLEVLDLSHNKISGEVPQCLMKLGKTLGVLNLGSNKLTGHIPNTFPSSCALQTIVLNGNQLVGPLPKSLTHCTALEVLNVGRNELVGAFPCFLSYISTLRVLILRNNKFHGRMVCPNDSCVWNMTQIVDVAFNLFSGELPVKWFIGWKKMISNDDGANSKLSHIQFGGGNNHAVYYQDSITVTSKGKQMELVKILTIFTSIDFSYNQFEGPIPKELTDFKALHLLNLSHNALSGQIPSSIGNLNQLESLDLSMNSLEGEIPIELANLNFLSVLNLSFNHLTGMIPTGAQLQSFEASSFEGNDGLYGPPLTKSPKHGMHVLPPTEMPPCGTLACGVHWNLVSAEMGLVSGLGIVFGPLLFWKRWRMRYCQFLDKILCRIFPQLSHEFERRGGQNYKVLVWRRY